MKSLIPGTSSWATAPRRPLSKPSAFHARMQETTRQKAVQLLQKELKDEKIAERDRRREITNSRRQAAEERRRLEEEKAKMGARRAARLRRKLKRTKKING